MQLASVCTIQSGYTARTALSPTPGEGVLAIQLRDIAPDGGIDPGTLSRIELGGVPRRYLAAAGDVVFRSRGTWNTATALDARFQEPAMAVLPLLILRPGSRVTAEYLAWAINQPETQRQLGTTAQGTNLRMVPKSTLDALEIDVPDLTTQRRIVAVAGLAAQEEALQHKLAAARRTLIGRRLAECARGERPSTTHKEAQE